MDDKIAMLFLRMFDDPEKRAQLCFSELTRGLNAMFYSQAEAKLDEAKLAEVLEYMQQYIKEMSI